MLLAKLIERPTEALCYMERYINDGSPSGFSQSHATSPETAPLGRSSPFRLYAVDCAPEELSVFGSFNNACTFVNAYEMLLHPDMAGTVPSRLTFPLERFLVSPTASARTVHVHVSKPMHLKLHYDGIIGRLNRSLGEREASYAVHINTLLEKYVYRHRAPKSFGILPEPYARVAKFSTVVARVEVGMVFRSLVAVVSSKQPHALIPGFALFSRDRLEAKSLPLALQMQAASKLPATEFLLECLLYPLIDSYFSVLLQLGLQSECHSQNIVIGISQEGAPTCILLRDMESVDTDRSLQEELGLKVDPPPVMHKVIDRSQYNYQIKHSFMFDHKLGEYLIDPLIRCFEDADLVKAAVIEDAIRHRVGNFLPSLPGDFFPTDGWFSFAKVQIDRSTARRPYERHDGIRFRPTK
jgi:ferric iron reductase FhuF-like transporter